MKINNELLKKYFNIQLSWVKDVPKVSIKLKAEYIGTKNIPYKSLSPKIPYSGVQLEYYLHYFDDVSIANDIWVVRKKLCSKHTQINWCINNLKLDNTEIYKLNKYLNSLNNKISKKIKEHYESEAGIQTKQKLKTKCKKWSKIVGKINSDKWNDIEWAATEMKRRNDSGVYETVAEKNRKRMNNPQYFDKFMKSVRKPERLNKISKSSKLMWQRLKRDTPVEYYNIINSGPNKNFELNGYNMNYVEFILGSVLNSLDIEWKYEFDFKFGNKIYVPDFYIPKSNVVIECYGDYWHANPIIYESESVIFGKIPANDIWQKDRIRKETFEDGGYVFLSFWERDIKNNINKVKHEIWQSILKKN
jgi:hypothetical protein